MSSPTTVEHLDVLIVGAGISGIGAAYYLQRDHPQRRFALLEARAVSGGTWDLFRYPGVRSDSDLYTFGYEFEPWRDAQSIAGADQILAYLRDTAAKHGIDRRVRYHRRVVAASWASDAGRWTVDVEHTDTGEQTQLTCSWLFCAGGYYRYDEGHTPVLPGRERFTGPVVHPQHWPADLDTTGQRVVVIGSGATAVTLVPALTETAAHVTMLQRTPTYVLPVPSQDKLANGIRRVLGEQRAHGLIRRINIGKGRQIWRLAQRYPVQARRFIRWVNTKQLPPGYPVDEHFNPPYGPWDQRLCAVPDGDLFRVIREGRAEVVTDRIETFTETGIRLASGRELPADLIVTATGLDVQAVGGIRLTVDGAEVRLPETVSYKGMMLSGVPNLAYAIGYTNSSWTLKVGLLCEHLCRLLSAMDAQGYDVARPELADPSMPTRPLLDFGAGYVQRAVDELPRQGVRAPWLTSTDYWVDVRQLGADHVADPELHLSRSGAERGTDPADRFVDLPAGPRLCYRVDGPDDGAPLLLVAGLGVDLTSWPQRMVDGYVQRGFRVIRFDNRDIGRSSKIAAPPPGPVRQLLARPRPDAYDLGDMAADTHGLLDHLQIERVHLVGMSMGGMIAQTLAARHPERVLTLTSIFSTTGHRGVGQPARSTLRYLARRPSRTVAESVERHRTLLQHIGSPTMLPDDDLEAAWAAGLWERGGGLSARGGVPRQIGAIQASGDRTPELRRITAPTLVVHGATDRMVHPTGGRATAAAIAGARFVEIAEMGHHLAPGVVDQLVELTADLVRDNGFAHAEAVQAR